MIKYKVERKICDYLGLDVDKVDYVRAYYGLGPSDGGRTPSGWQIVCHISHLKSYITRKIHIEHNNKVIKR